MAQKRSCLYKLRFSTYPRGPPFFLGLIGAIIRSWNLRSGPFSRASNYPWAQCARWLISSVVAPATWLALFIRVLFLTLSLLRLSPSLPPSLPHYMLTSFFFSFRTSRSGPVQSQARMLLLADSHSPSTWFILNPCSLSSWSRPQTRFCCREKMILRNWRAFRSIVVLALYKILPRWRSLLCPCIYEKRSLLAEFTQRARCQNDFASAFHRAIVLRGMIRFDVCYQ